jgi:hypothetical protein
MVITEYSVDRCYGGPEEGGWWFDNFQPTGRVVAVFVDATLAPCVAQALTERAQQCKDGTGRDSVIGTPDLVYLAEERIGENRTLERPVYC